MHFGKFKHFHFVGIGGIGMSGIAEILLHQGFQVSGSDVQDGPIPERLRTLGARIFIGHCGSNLRDAQVLVFSSAIRKENPEMEAAAAQGIPTVRRAEVLGELMRFKKGIAIAGTHGKTTTTTMVALVLIEAGMDPTVLVGARYKGFGSNARPGRGDFVVAEADESDRSFLRLSPVHTVVTNIDCDHMDEYRDLADIQEAFRQHLESIPFYGAIVACFDDPNLRPLIKNIHQRVLTYGLSPQANISARDVKLSPLSCAYGCFRKEVFLGQVELNVPGRHNVLNSLAAVAMGLALDVPFDAIQRALAGFRGAERRLEWKGEKAGVWVLDDYGHHPAEIRMTLEACRSSGRRIVAVFQPHRYSRTQYLMDDFGACFEDADLLYLMDIYSAGEEPIPGVTAGKLAGKIGAHRQVHFVPDRQALLQQLQTQTREGDLLLTLGAGDVWKTGEAFLEQN
ncbi:MAG: UDP-N-acetylmuramate--L-alanine ligase [Acidobacteriota bacterium]